MPSQKNTQDLGIVFFPAYDFAISPTHPEREERLLYTQDQLREEGLFDMAGIMEYKPDVASYEDIQRTHFCFPSVEQVASASHLASAGGAIRAAKLVMEKQCQRAFALVRPPGHHAMRITHGNRGFCNVNIEAIMLDYIRHHYPLETGEDMRIAVVDTDCHHGDGSQDIFWNDPNTLFISLHQDGRTLYPGSGFIPEAGGPSALGKTVNIPLPPKTGDAGYLYAMEHAVLPILEHFKPHLIINSAGQDNHFTDPLADMRLTAQGYAKLTSLLKPHIAVLEGGYAIRGALPYVNLAICLALAEKKYTDIFEPQWSSKLLEQDAKVSTAIEHICHEVLEQYFSPPNEPHEGHRKNQWWFRERHIYYDTDMITDKQREQTKLCPHCAGFVATLTQSSKVKAGLCIQLARTACEHCRQEAEDMLHNAQKKSSPYSHVCSMGF